MKGVTIIVTPFLLCQNGSYGTDCRNKSILLVYLSANHLSNSVEMESGSGRNTKKMKIFQPDLIVKNVTMITTELLRKHHIKALVLDVDNTLTTHGNPKPGEGVLQWLETMRQADIPMMIVSNNSHGRVKPFAELLQLEFVSRGWKPLTVGMTKACKRFGLSPSEVAIVGDQLFTDILGGKLKGMKCILTEPICLESGPFFKLKRKLESKLMKTER